MSNGIRIFVILAIFASGMTALKVLTISDEVLRMLDPAQAAWAAGSKKEKKPKNSKKKPKAKGKTDEHAKAAPNILEGPELPMEVATCKPVSFAEQAGLSEQELKVVMRLSERREDLDRRERDLLTREAVVSLSEKKLDDRLGTIDAAIAKYDERIGILDEQEEARMASVVKTYESMKPKNAATIFNALDDKVLLQVATRMKPAVMAKVLAAMDTARATHLTIEMTRQFDTPSSAQALLDGESAIATEG